MKKLLFLGASWGQMPPLWHVQKNKDVEIYTADSQLTNPGHKLAVKSFNISSADTPLLRAAAKENGIDCVLCYASDVGQASATILSKELGNFFNPLIAVETLINKYLFKDLLNQHEIQTTFLKKISSNDLLQEEHLQEILENLPLVSKPILGSGSKGVRFIYGKSDLSKIRESFEYSDNVILESYLKKEGSQICGDGFFQNGKLSNFTAGDGLFYEEHELQIPYAESFPSTHAEKIIHTAKDKVEEILRLSGFVRGNINFDIIVCLGEPYIIEIAPRPGGNFIPEVIKQHNGIDLIDAFIQNAMDENYIFNQKIAVNNFVSSYMIHSLEEGVIEKLFIDERLKPYIIREHLFNSPGDKVRAFKQGSDAIGNIQMMFPTQELQIEMMSSINNLIQIQLQ